MNERPVRHTVKGTGFAIHSQNPLPKNSPLVRELESLRAELQTTLKLPRQRDSVSVYLFPGQEAYRRYMGSTWPNLPPRRAYFVGTSRELAVYSYQSSRVQEDLRHEFTHGLLHASLNTVPLWLDEGLAEYFEVKSEHSQRPHQLHLQMLQKCRAEGWAPNLETLEQLTDFRKMTLRDYAESWGWVHYMLQSDTRAQQVLISYLHDLQNKSTAPLLQPKLRQAAPGCDTGMLSHITDLSKTVSVVKYEK
ncbi:MAG: DUF1570 domain-containing protein [Planctomycetaceae bacterium]